MIAGPLAMISLLLGILTGLQRLGWQMPDTNTAAQHGALMVGSFLGTVILVERIVAIKLYWLYIFPIMSGLSTLAFVLSEKSLAFIMLTMASVGLIISYLIIINRHKAFYFYVMLAGAMCWFAGNVFLLQGGMYAVSSTWWMAFILLTIVGERLELSKFVPDARVKKPLMWGLLVLIVAGLLMPFHTWGNIVFGGGLAGLAIWLFKFDIIRKSIKLKGLHRYTAILLGLGYFWLLVSGGLMMVGFDQALNYDAALHAFFLGFTFSMIFAHGPMILPGVAGLPIKPFRSIFYLWGALLSLATLLRVLADWFYWMEWRQWSGAISGISIIAFFASLIFAVFEEKRKLSSISMSKVN